MNLDLPRSLSEFGIFQGEEHSRILVVKPPFGQAQIFRVELSLEIRKAFTAALYLLSTGFQFGV